MKKALFVLFFAAVVFAGCKKQEAPVAPEQTPAAAPEATAAPTATGTPTDAAAPAAPEAPATK